MFCPSHIAMVAHVVRQKISTDCPLQGVFVIDSCDTPQEVIKQCPVVEGVLSQWNVSGEVRKVPAHNLI